MLAYDILEMNAEEVESFSNDLASAGFEYDRDFTTVYGNGWELVGVRLLSSRAIQYAGHIA